MIVISTVSTINVYATCVSPQVVRTVYKTEVRVTSTAEDRSVHDAWKDKAVR